jgi:hypothetical protein
MSPATYEQPQSKSTGPRTDEGKRKSALNAMRHGLTGRTIVMPHEDMQAYHAFCKELFEDLAPETSLERQCAQTFCDTQWRLNRARSIEDAMIALGHAEAAGNIETEHPQVYAALTAARVFRDDSKSFVNLSLYEQRLQRTLDKALRQLQTLQAERRAQAQTATTEPQDPEPPPNQEQFVFSTAENTPVASESAENSMTRAAENSMDRVAGPERERRDLDIESLPVGLSHLISPTHHAGGSCEVAPR